MNEENPEVELLIPVDSSEMTHRFDKGWGGVHPLPAAVFKTGDAVFLQTIWELTPAARELLKEPNSVISVLIEKNGAQSIGVRLIEIEKATLQ